MSHRAVLWVLFVVGLTLIIGGEFHINQRRGLVCQIVGLLCLAAIYVLR